MLMNTSSRSKRIFTGRPALRLSSAAAISWGKGSLLPPYAPPTNGRMTRMRCMGISITLARARCR